jgi:hypothetical protein
LIMYFTKKWMMKRMQNHLRELQEQKEKNWFFRQNE